MKNVKCVHPIKVNKIIKTFLEDVVVLPIDIEVDCETDTEVYYAVEGDIVGGDEEITVFVPNWRKVNLNDDEAGKLFRKDFTDRCSLAKGFSDITISLLHEIGHTMTKDYLPNDYDRDKECEKVDEIKIEKDHQLAYFKMLDEVLATDWAIEWLNDAENRKIAKKFEKKFWNCFE